MVENEDGAVQQGNEFVEIRENKERLILSNKISVVFSTWVYMLAVNHAISRYFAVLLIAE